MGFGSYDESDQREPEFDTEGSQEDDVELHQHDYEGTASFDSGASTSDLLDRLAGIKADADEE